MRYMTRFGLHFLRYHVLRLLRLLLILQLVTMAGLLHAAGPRVGDTPSLPAFSTLDGKNIDPSMLRGKYVVFSYFSVNCPFCMNEAPHLQKLYHANSDKVIVIGINIDYEDPFQRSNTKKWVEKYQLTHPVTTDYKLLERALGKPIGLPVNYVLDRKGKIVRIDVGEIFKEDFDEIAKMARAK